MNLEVVNDEYYLVKRNSVLETEQVWALDKKIIFGRENDPLNFEDLLGSGKEMFKGCVMSQVLILEDYVVGIEILDEKNQLQGESKNTLI